MIKQILFTAIMIIGFSVAASAQKDDGKKDPPPKPKPPVIVVKPKDPPKDPPKDDNGKKPTASLNGFLRNDEVIIV